MALSDIRTAAIVVLVVILIFVVTYCSGTAQRTRIEHLEGVWLADSSFCDDAGLDTMILYLDKPKTGWRAITIGGYLIATANKEVIESSPVTLELRERKRGHLEADYTCHLTGLVGIDVIPDDIFAHIDFHTDNITLYGYEEADTDSGSTDRIVYAELFRNGALTAAGDSVDEDEDEDDAE